VQVKIQLECEKALVFLFNLAFQLRHKTSYRYVSGS